MHNNTITTSRTTTAARRRLRFAMAATAFAGVSLMASSGADAAGHPAKVRNGDQLNCLGSTDVTRCGGGIRFI